MNRNNIGIRMLSFFLTLAASFPAWAGAPAGPEEIFCGLTADGQTVTLTAEEAAGMEAEAALEEEETPKPLAVLAYTEEDLYVLAHQICGEAQNCSDEEQLYVGSVVLNRVNHPAYPNTVKGVVFQRGQYACTRDGNYYREPTAQNWANARYLLENGSLLPANVVYQSGRRQGHGVYCRTKHHYYCYY